MKIYLQMIKLLRIIYTFYVALIFIMLLLVTLPFFFLFSWLFGDKALGVFVFLCRFIAWGLGILGGFIYKIHRNPNVNRSETFVVIANHRSNLDAPLAAISCWGRVRYLAKKELLKVPLMGNVFKITTVNVDRTSKESRKISMLAMMDYLRKGDHIFIFPEGTRNKTADQTMIEFKDGAFLIAIQTQKNILPMIYLNTEILMPNKPLWMRPGIAHVYEMDPIDVSEYTEKDVQKLKEEARRRMVEKYEELLKEQRVKSKE